MASPCETRLSPKEFGIPVQKGGVPRCPFLLALFSFFCYHGKKKKRRAPHGKADSLSETVEEKAARGKPETPEHLGAAEPRHPPARKPQSLQPQKSTETDGRSPFLCFFFLGKTPDCFSSLPMLYWWGRGIPDAPRPALPRASPFFFGRRAICYSEKERAPCREDTFKI